MFKLKQRVELSKEVKKYIDKEFQALYSALRPGANAWAKREFDRLELKIDQRLEDLNKDFWIHQFIRAIKNEKKD